MPPAFLSTSAVDVGSAAAVRLVTRGLGDHVDLLALALVIAPMVSTFIIGARIAVRVRSKQMKQDDFWIIASGLLSWVFFAVYFNTSKLLNGRQVSELSPLEIQSLLKFYFSQEMVYFFALTAVKVSILIFYLRAIGTTVLTRRLIYFLMAFVVAYGIARVFATLFECWPVSYFWDRTQRGTCVDYHALLTSVTVINMITDVAILVFPMPIVWKLRIPRKQKVSICLVFCVGGLACGTAIARIYVMEKIFTSDVGSLLNDDAAPKLVLCGCLELNIGIASACLPTLRSSFRKLTTFFHSHRRPSFSTPRFKLETFTTRKASLAVLDMQLAAVGGAKTTGDDGGKNASTETSSGVPLVPPVPVVPPLPQPPRAAAVAPAKGEAGKSKWSVMRKSQSHMSDKSKPETLVETEMDEERGWRVVSFASAVTAVSPELQEDEDEVDPKSKKDLDGV